MGEIRVKDLSCAYRNVTALKNINASFPQGSLTALIGSNGSGKSTLLGALAGTITPVSGSISGLPKEIAFVPQRSHVPENLPISVWHTVSMGRWRSRRPWQRLSASDRNIINSELERLGISDLASRPLGELSGGQRQRALIAQGLAQQAPLLLFDEPLSAIDADATLLIAKVIAEEKEAGKTIIIATHDVAQTRDADRTITLERGEIKCQHKASESIM